MSEERSAKSEKGNAEVTLCPLIAFRSSLIAYSSYCICDNPGRPPIHAGSQIAINSPTIANTSSASAVRMATRRSDD